MDPGALQSSPCIDASDKGAVIKEGCWSSQTSERLFVGGSSCEVESHPMHCRNLARISLRLCIAATAAAVMLASTAQAQTSQAQSLHDALHLSAAQEDAWRTFQAATAPDSDQAAREQSAAQMMPTLSAPRRVDLSIAVMQADLATLERRGVALKAFYATLSAEQQKIFDQQTAPQSPPSR